MSLANTDDLEARLGRPLSDTEPARSSALLDDVSASVQVYTGQKFTRSTYEVRARIKRGVVRLAQRPVHDVETVADRFGNDIEFDWDGLDRVYIACHRSGHAPLQVVDVTYDAGPDEVPQVIVGIVCNIALRSLGRDPSEGGTISETVDGYTFRLGSASGAGAYGLLPEEKRTLDAYRRPFGNIRVAS